MSILPKKTYRLCYSNQNTKDIILISRKTGSEIHMETQAILSTKALKKTKQETSQHHIQVILQDS